VDINSAKQCEMSSEREIRDEFLIQLITWASIRHDDQKMMFCARQTAEVIHMEHMNELTLAFTVLASLDIDVDPSAYLNLNERFHDMVIEAIRMVSSFADEHGLAQFQS